MIIYDNQSFVDEIAELLDTEFEAGRALCAAEFAQLIEDVIGGDETAEPETSPIPRGRFKKAIQLAREFCQGVSADYGHDGVIFLPSQGEVKDRLATLCEQSFQAGKSSFGRTMTRMSDKALAELQIGSL